MNHKFVKISNLDKTKKNKQTLTNKLEEKTKLEIKFNLNKTSIILTTHTATTLAIHRHEAFLCLFVNETET